MIYKLILFINGCEYNAGEVHENGKAELHSKLLGMTPVGMPQKWIEILGGYYAWERIDGFKFVK